MIHIRFEITTNVTGYKSIVNGLKSFLVSLSLCMCVRVRERVCVCVCVAEI